MDKELVEICMGVPLGGVDLDSLIHQALGWQKRVEWDECSRESPGARFVNGLEYWECQMTYYIPDDLEDRFMQMYIDEGEDPPEEYDRIEAVEWWLGDERLEQYPQGYSTNLQCARLVMPRGSLWAVSSMEDGPNANVIVPMPGGGFVGGAAFAEAKTVELALCAAGLKGHIIQQGETQ